MADKVKVLVVEDNDLNREVVEFILRNKGMEFVSATNGLEAVDIYSDSELYEFSLILMDLIMPSLDGLEATRIIRGLNREDACCVPIIAMTSCTHNEDIEECFEVGMNAHVAKPVRVETLMKVIKQFVEV